MDLAQEVGYLKGMQEATQRELIKLNDAVGELQSTSATKHDVENLRTELSDKIDEAVTKLQGGSGSQIAQQNQTVVQTILKSPLTPMIIVVLAMFGTLAVVFSRETGKPASSFIPYPAAVAPVPPGGSATSTTTVTAPPAETPP